MYGRSPAHQVLMKLIKQNDEHEGFCGYIDTYCTLSYLPTSQPTTICYSRNRHRIIRSQAKEKTRPALRALLCHRVRSVHRPVIITSKTTSNTCEASSLAQLHSLCSRFTGRISHTRNANFSITPCSSSSSLSLLAETLLKQNQSTHYQR